MARSRPKIEFPEGDGKSSHLVDRRAETGLNFRSTKNERVRDRKAKHAVQYALRKKNYLNKTEGVKNQRSQDEALKRAARRRLQSR